MRKLDAEEELGYIIDTCLVLLSKEGVKVDYRAACLIDSIYGTAFELLKDFQNE